MRLQLLSDLHLETESFDPIPAPDAELLVLAGDVDSGWGGLQKFRGWPVPILYVPGNHEYDQRDFDAARAGLVALSADLGFTMLDDAAVVITDAEGRRVRFLGTTRWSDFEVFGEAMRAKAMRAASYFQRGMAATRHGLPFDAAAVRDEGLRCRAWLTEALAAGESTADWGATVAITHFAPSLKSGDPRFGKQPGTASFCNDDEALMPGARLWLHGHVHFQHDYRVGATRVVSNPRGHGRKGEPLRFEPLKVIEVFETVTTAG